LITGGRLENARKPLKIIQIGFGDDRNLRLGGAFAIGGANIDEIGRASCRERV